MTLPNVLIIGSMKAGTTSLYMDLADRPGSFLAQDKEPHALCYDRVMSSEGRTEYESIYRLALPQAVCIDASTGYAKRPDFEGVVSRATMLLPPGFKVIYLVRHPIDRIVSQHHHEHFEGLVGPSIDEEVRRHERYIHYSRYAFQLAPWLEQLGPDRIRVVRFEDYINQRRGVVRDLLAFLNLPDQEQAETTARIYNKSQGKPVKSQAWEAVRNSGVYRRWLRPLAPPKVRLAIQKLILPKVKTSLVPPSVETINWLRDSLVDDVRQLEAIIGRPMAWDGFEQQ